MEKYLPYTECMARLRAVKDEYNGKNMRIRVSAVQACMDELDRVTGKTINFQAEESKRVQSLEPFFPKGVIGRDVYHYEKCGTQVGKKDIFCKTCGRKLVDVND